MLSVEHRGLKLCDGLTRRQWLAAGAIAPMGLALADLLAARATAGPSGARPRAKACIQIFLWGGPGAQETWDIKPEAPSATRGDFKPIATSVPGTQICEHLPRLAALADRYAIVRSLAHSGVNHGTSAYHMLTGHIHPTPGTLKHPTPQDMPQVGANAARFLAHPNWLPAHVHLPAIINDGDGLPVPGQGPGILGDQHAPFCVLGDPTQPDFRVPALALQQGVSRQRLAERMTLRQALDRQADSAAAAGVTAETWRRQAFDLLQSVETERAFNLSLEPEGLRDEYGQHHFGQSLVLARRLIEAGVPLVTVYWNSPGNASDQSWDTHNEQHRRMKEHLLPHFDRALAALLNDLQQRGMLDQTLVTWHGEFGRTPRINSAGGRDHWGFCQSIGLAGGGARPGLVHGASTRDGGYPERDAVSPDDLAATVYHCLGIDHRQHMYDQQRRPIPLSYGEPVMELLT